MQGLQGRAPHPWAVTAREDRTQEPIRAQPEGTLRRDWSREERAKVRGKFDAYKTVDYNSPGPDEFQAPVIIRCGSGGWYLSWSCSSAYKCPFGFRVVSWSQSGLDTGQKFVH
uniref:Uncharacterized protein n=1 Tax=Knipowitschia caucasica TaxID=637954 RepID=A0AAV2IRK5_KNICA